MKWIGQHIWAFITRFRNTVYFEDLKSSTSTDALVVDEQGKVSKNSLTIPPAAPVDSVTAIAPVSSTGDAITISPNVGAVQVRPNAYRGGTNVGHVPPGGSATTFLRGDATWVVPTNTTYSGMTATVFGLGKLEDNTTQTTAANAVTTTASRTYGIQFNASEQLCVNVPWTDTVYTLPEATSSVRGGLELFSDVDNPVAANAVSSTAARTYGLQLNAAGQGVINVPWENDNTTYSAGDGLDLAGTTFSTDLRANGGLVINATELQVDLAATDLANQLKVSKVANQFIMVTCSATVSTSATAGEASAVVIPWDTTPVQSGSPVITLSSNAILMSTDGVYKFDWSVATDTLTTNNRVLLGIKMEKGTWGGAAYTWADVSPTHGWIYNRGNGQIREGSVSGSILINHSVAATGPAYRIVLWKEKASVATTQGITIIKGCQLNVTQLS